MLMLSTALGHWNILLSRTNRSWKNYNPAARERLNAIGAMKDRYAVGETRRKELPQRLDNRSKKRRRDIVASGPVVAGVLVAHAGYTKMFVAMSVLLFLATFGFASMKIRHDNPDHDAR